MTNPYCGKIKGPIFCRDTVDLTIHDRLLYSINDIRTNVWGGIFLCGVGVNNLFDGNLMLNIVSN